MRNKLYFPTGSHIIPSRAERIKEVLGKEDISVRLVNASRQVSRTIPDLAVMGGYPGTANQGKIYLVPLVSPSYREQFTVFPVREIAHDVAHMLHRRIRVGERSEIINVSDTDNESYLMVDAGTKNGRSNPYHFVLEIPRSRLVFPE